MSLISDMLAAAGRLLTYYNGDEKAADNPGGMTGVGGMADNWDPCIRDIGTVANGVGEALTAVAASQTAAAGSATAAAGSASAAATSAGTAHTDRLAADAAAAATAADRTAVVTDKTAAHADRLAADADAQATAADRLAVAADKTAVHTDRLTADADAQATASDRTAVAADRAAVATDAAAAHTDRLAADASAAAAAASAASVALPAITAADSGKSLGVSAGGLWQLAKYLPVDAAGALVGRLQTLTGTSAQLLAVSLGEAYSGFWRPGAGIIAMVANQTEVWRTAATGVLTMLRALRSPAVVLTWSSTVTIDANAGNRFALRLGGATTIANPTNLADGQEIVLLLQQDSNGNRTVSWGSYWRFPNGTAPTLSTGANIYDRVVGDTVGTTTIQAVAIKGWAA